MDSTAEELMARRAEWKEVDKNYALAKEALNRAKLDMENAKEAMASYFRKIREKAQEEYDRNKRDKSFRRM